MIKSKLIQDSVMQVMQEALIQSQEKLRLQVMDLVPTVGNLHQTTLSNVVDRLVQRKQLELYTVREIDGNRWFWPRKRTDKGPGKYVSIPLAFDKPLAPDLCISCKRSSVQVNEYSWIYEFALTNVKEVVIYNVRVKIKIHPEDGDYKKVGFWSYLRAFENRMVPLWRQDVPEAVRYRIEYTDGYSNHLIVDEILKDDFGKELSIKGNVPDADEIFSKTT